MDTQKKTPKRTAKRDVVNNGQQRERENFSDLRHGGRQRTEFLEGD